MEPPLLEIPWKQDIAEGSSLPEKLCIAILWDDGVVLPHPPILDALKRAKDALVRAGHEIINWDPVDHGEAWNLIVSRVRPTVQTLSELVVSASSTFSMGVKSTARLWRPIRLCLNQSGLWRRCPIMARRTRWRRHSSSI